MTPAVASASASPASAQNSPAEDLRHRRHTLRPNRSLLESFGLGIQNWLERRVAAASPLGDPHIYNTRDFPWAREIEREWPLIRKELDAVMVFRDQMPSFQDILKEVGAIQSDNNWKTYFLAGIGMDCSENARRCPETARLLGRIPGMTTAFFSILSPGKHIPAHRGAWNGILRLHVGLMVPQPRERVKIRVGNDFYSWREGEAFIFDDTFNHEVWNDTDDDRVLLMVETMMPLPFPLSVLNRFVQRQYRYHPSHRGMPERVAALARASSHDVLDG